MRVMRLISDKPEMSTRHIADEVGISNGSAYYLLTAFVEKGFVKLGNFKNNKSVFFGMLTKFRNTSLLTMINGVSIAQDAENWSKYKEMAQNIKRDSGYVGAGPLHYSAYFIQDAHSKNNRAEMASRYSRLVEDAI